jgi:hypothetical protein
VGLYNLNTVAPQLETAWFQPLRLRSETLVQKFAASNSTRTATQRLRETGLWLIDEEGYYSGEGSKGFVAMSPKDQPPAELLTKGIANHLAAAAWYRLAIRNLIAVARATG